MGRFVEGDDHSRSTLSPERLGDYLTEGKPVWAVDAFGANLDLAALFIDQAFAQSAVRPEHHPVSC